MGTTFLFTDIRNGRLYEVTNSSLVNERFNEISVCGDTGRVVYVQVGNGGFDVYAFTFQVPSVPSDTEDQLNDLHCLNSKLQPSCGHREQLNQEVTKRNRCD
jgi:hypothetical protein